MKTIFEVVKILDTTNFKLSNGEDFRFRLEILKKINKKVFIAKVYRLETYRLQPTFPQSNGVLPDWKNDTLIFVTDDMFDSAKLKGRSVKDVFMKFKIELKKMFNQG